MESATKSDAMNGTPQKVVKPTGVTQDASGPTVERNGDRGETIEDIISELNATAKKDEPLAELLMLDCLESEKKPDRSSSDQCDRKTESMESSPGSVGEVGTRSEAKPSTALTDAPVGGEGEVPVPRTDEIPSEDGEKAAEAPNGGATELGGQGSPEYSGATGGVVEPEHADECSDQQPEETNPDPAQPDADSKEATTCEIKAPEEALQSPRRTARQRTASQRLAESNASSPSRLRRLGSEGSFASSVESTPTKRSTKQCLTSDSESDVPLAQSRSKRLGSKDQPTVAVKTKRLTSDSESDVTPAQKRQKTMGTKGKSAAAVKAKKLASDGESDVPIAQTRQKTTGTKGQSTAAVKVKQLASDSESDSPLAKGKKVPTREPSSATEVTDRSQARRASRVQSVGPPSKRRGTSRSLKQSLEISETSADNREEDVHDPEFSCTTDTGAMEKKSTPSLASKTKRKAAQRKLSADSHRSAPVEQSLREDHVKPDGASELGEEKGDMSMLECALTAGSAASAGVKKMKKTPRAKELKKEDNVDVLATSAPSVSNISSSGGSCIFEREKHISKQTGTPGTVENVPWSARQFTESDRLLQESINLSLKDQEPVAGRSYLMVEVPSGNARRTWGSTSTCPRPTVVFGGCDPLCTYVNVEGVRVLLRQWQQVSRITPNVLLTDIFRRFPSF